MMCSLTPVTATLIDRYDDGQDARHFSFELTALSAASTPSAGQFFMLTIPGQGEAAFTYVKLPDARGRFDALVRRVGTLTSELFELSAGAVVGIRGPLGRGLPAIDAGRVLIVAGGCGLAPLSPAVEALRRESGVRLAVLYGARSRATQVLSRERASWRRELPVIEVFDHEPDAPRVTPVDALDRAWSALGGVPDHVLICGPDPMMHATAQALTARGLVHERLWLSVERRMHCGVGLCGHCYLGTGYACVQGPTYRYDELLRELARHPSRPEALTAIHHC